MSLPETTPQDEQETLGDKLIKEGFVPTVKYDEDTGEAHLVYILDLTKDG